MQVTQTSSGPIATPKIFKEKILKTDQNSNQEENIVIHI